MVQRDLPYEPDGVMDGTGATIDAPEGETEPMTVPAVPEEQRNEDTPQLSHAASLSFESEEGFRGAAVEWPMKQLVEVWNGLPVLRNPALLRQRGAVDSESLRQPAG